MTATATTRSSDRTPVLVGGLLAVAGLGWWWSVESVGSMTPRPSMGPGTSMGRGTSMAVTMSLGSFFVAWMAMMAAMMLPAIVPAVRLFDRAAARDQAVATPIFVGGYVIVWSAVGVPVYFAWRALADPIGRGDRWAGYLAGAIFAAAAVYQVSPLKSACLRHCRTPLSFFLRQKSNLKTPLGAARAGIGHGVICVGCCWAAMAVLIALGTMNLAWMLAVAVLISAEKVAPHGRLVSSAAALAMAALGVALLIHPHLLVRIT